MPDGMVEIVFDNAQRSWRPGERLSGRYRLVADVAPELERQELSIVWYTSGKGDEDLEVHQYEECRADSPTWTNPQNWKTFSCVLPLTPLSYDGVLVKIHWCVRVRYFPVRGEQLVGEAPFQLGNVAQGNKVEGAK